MHVIGLCSSGSLNVTWKKTATTLLTIIPLRRTRGYPEVRRERPPHPTAVCLERLRARRTTVRGETENGSDKEAHDGSQPFVVFECTEKS